MSKYKEILDPLWITKKEEIDSEYFSYILLGARDKYITEIENGDISKFYEVMFHFFNLNNLLLDGNLFDFKMNSSLKDPNIKKIKRDLKEFYGDMNESGETIKVAHSILSDVLLKYLKYQVEVFDTHGNLFYVNPQLHLCDDIFIVMNRADAPTYDIWRFKLDKRCSMGYKFDKIETLEMDSPMPNELKKRVAALNHPLLNKMDSAKNVCFCATQDDEFSLDQIAQIAKHIVLVNKVMIKAPVFDPNVLANAHTTLWSDRVLPFKLNQQAYI